MSLRTFRIATLVGFTLMAGTPEVWAEANPTVQALGVVEEGQVGASPPVPSAAPLPVEMTQSPLKRAGESVSAVAPAPTHALTRGRIGYDAEGRPGHIHSVASADTLWDISELYLGTPWVWPSIWQDNQRIDNPHLIFPGDQIWISAYEMRRITEEEAAFMVSNVPEDVQPAAAPDPGIVDLPAELPAAAPEPERVVSVSGLESSGLVTEAQLQAAASIIAGIPERVYFAQPDEVYVGLGEGQSEVGETFNIVRTQEAVRDPDSGKRLGYHVEILGWLEIKEVFPETSLATIRMSTGEIQLEDRLIRRTPLPAQVSLQPSPAHLEGKIAFFPRDRVLMGLNDFVYLNRGALDGLEVGSPLEVYRLGFTASETTRSSERVAVPDRRVARMVVVRADSQASVALVLTADTELEIGDRFRGAR